MGNLRRKFTTELKEEIVARVKTGEKSVSELAKDYGLPPKYIYNWISSPINKDPYILKINRLEREKSELLQIIGELTADIKREKKEGVYGRK